MEDSSTTKSDTGNKQVQIEPIETQDEGTILSTNYLLVLLVSLVILNLLMIIIATYLIFYFFLFSVNFLIR